MKIGLFFEHQVPRPWADGDEERVLLEALEQCELADRIGIHTAWVVEHHFLEEYSHSSAPEVFLAAVSQRTRRLRLGHGIVQMPPAFNHPVRVAERLATLDLLSGGRVEFGTGESSSEAELGGFGIEPGDKRSQWREALGVTLRCLTESPFTGHAGDWLTVPPRNVVPKPRQRPHPPVWVACTRRDTIHLAAQLGIGALSFAFLDPEEARQWVTDYYETLAGEAVPIGDAVNANLACVTTFMCHPDEGEAIRRGAEGTNFLGYSLAHYYVFGRHRPGVTDVWAEYQSRRAEAGYDPDAVHAAAARAEGLGAKATDAGIEGLRGAVGTPAQVREYLERYEALGVDQVILATQTGRNRHEHVMESLELFGREVLPAFAERDEEIAAKKADRLAPAIEAARSRKPAEHHPRMLEDYEIPAIPRSTADRQGADGFHAWLDDYARQTAAGQDVSRRLAHARHDGTRDPQE